MDVSADASEVILGADFGSSGVKAMLFTRSLVPVASTWAGYPVERPHPGHAEQHPEHLREALRVAVASLLADAGVAPTRIAAIGMSSNYPSLLPLDAEGNPLLPAQTWMDERGADHCAEVQQALASVPNRVNGNPVEGFYPLPKALWLREHRPEVLERTAAFVQLHSYLVGLLTGEAPGCDRTTASWFHNYDIWNDRWDERVAEALHLPISVFPEVRPAWDIAGTITGNAAREFGLATGTPVVVGTGDAVAAALGAGVGEVSQAYMTTGTGGCVCVVTSEPQFRRGLVTEAYVLPGSWLIEGIIKNIGVLLQWYVRELGRAEQESADAKGLSPFALLDAEAATSVPGSGGLVCLPYFSGEQSPVNDPAARGVLLGLTLETTRGDVIRALMEGVAYALAHNLETIATAGAAISELRVTGGPASSDLWMGIMADVAGVPIVRPTVSESAPLGSAMLAALAIGAIDGPADARTVVHVERRFEPQEAVHDRYRALFQTYKELYERTRPLNAGLANLAGNGEEA